jgi:hypothetical protein
MAAKALKKIAAPLPPTAEELAAQVVDLSRRREALEKDLGEAVERCFSIEKERVSGKKINELEYRKSRDIQLDFESRLAAVERMLVDTQQQGEKVWADEIMSRELSLKKERGELVRERRHSVEAVLMPLFAAFLVEREVSTELGLNRLDPAYLAAMPGVGFGPEEKRVLVSEVEKLRADIDFENSLGAKLGRIADDLRKISNRTLPSFARMVQDAR